MKYNYYTNEDLEKGIQVITRKMTLDNWRPDFIVGVLRGGIIPAVYLSHWFECPMMSIEWSTRDGAVGKEIDHRIIKRLLKNEKMLLVDDICDSGLTLREIFDEFTNQEYLSQTEMSIFDIKVACLHYNIGQDIFDPDYYHLEINKNEDPRWVIYNWEDM